MLKGITRVALLGIAASIAAPATGAVVPKTPRDLAVEADRIVIGDVIEVKSYWTAEGSIRTDLSIQVTDNVKGGGADVVVLHQRGGLLEDIGYSVNTEPMFVRGAHVLLFMAEFGEQYQLEGAFQGAWLTDGNMAGMAEGGYTDRLLEGQVLMTLADLVEEIRVALPPNTVIDSTSKYDGDYDLPLPGLERFVLLGFDWTYQANPMGENYVINGNCVDGNAGTSTDQINQINLGADAWTDSGADYEFTYGGTHLINNDNFDGVNRVYFLTPSALPGSTIASTGIFFSGANILEWDMEWNDEDFNFWDGGGACPFNHQDIRSIATHELGHALGLDHTPITAATMFATIASCDTTPRTLHSDDIAGIIAIYGADPEAGTTTLPFFDDFPSTVIDASLWTGVDGALINNAGLNPPSAPNSMNLDGSLPEGGDEIRSARMDATGLTDVTLTYHWQRTGSGNSPEVGEDLEVFYNNPAETWVLVNTHPGDGPDMTTFTQATVVLPADAAHTNLRVRFKANSLQAGADDWFIDNVGIDGSNPPANDDCAAGQLTGDAAIAFSTVGATTDGFSDSGVCAAGADAENDIWYVYFVSCTGDMMLELTGLDYDAVVTVYPDSACPTGANQAVACMVAPGQTSMTVPVTGGTRRIRVGGANNSEGTGTLTISCSAGPTFCQTDCDGGGDGNVDVADLLTLLAEWGTVGPHDCDVDPAPGGNGNVDVGDLLALLAEWSTPCVP